MKHIPILLAAFLTMAAAHNALAQGTTPPGVTLPEHWSAVEDNIGKVTLSYTGDKRVKAVEVKQFTFSVSATEKVIFSRGNLQYEATSATTGTFKFAEHQWDMIGYGNSKIGGNNYPYTIDLFGWGMWLDKPPAETDDVNPLKNSSSPRNYIPSITTQVANLPTKTAKSTRVEGKEWRVLTSDEWVYLIGVRNKDSRPNATSLYGKATVNSVHGLVILPDDWQLPQGAVFNSGYNPDFGWSYNVYDADQWKVMESAGAVFLPAAGYRDDDGVDYVGSDSSYWSSSANGKYSAMELNFSDDYPGKVYPNSFNPRNFGQSVRLVRPL